MKSIFGFVLIVLGVGPLAFAGNDEDDPLLDAKINLITLLTVDVLHVTMDGKVSFEKETAFPGGEPH